RRGLFHLLNLVRGVHVMRLWRQLRRYWKPRAAGPSAAGRKRARLAVERLEERDVPTALFTPQFGPETVTYHRGELLPDPPVYLLFAVLRGQPPGLSQLAAAIQAQTASLLSGPYLSGLQQYSVPGHTIDGHAHLDKVAFDSSDAKNGFSQGQVEDVIDRQV